MPLTIADSLTPDDVFIDVEASSKKQLLETLSQHIAKRSEALDADSVFESLIERERLGCTAADHGIAMPHARMKHAQRPVGVFARLASTLDFDGKDVPDVDLLFCFVLPEETSPEHDQALQKLAERIMSEATCDALREARDAATIIDILQSASHASPPTALKSASQ